MNRRDFLRLGLGAGSLLGMGGSTDLVARVLGRTATRKKVIILGLDGLDHHLVEIFIKGGKLPAFQKLLAQGDSRPLATSIPPQSPVAWSNFITGMDPGGHAIFDFLHRNTENYGIEFSGSRSEEAKRTVSIGDFVLPLSPGKMVQLREGKAFWQILEEHDIPATVFKIPSNFPPVPSRQRTLSGMGTPDIKGYSNLFNYYTTASAQVDADIGGGRVHPVYVVGNRVEARLPGPENTFKKARSESFLDFKVYLDPLYPLAKIAFPDQEFILQEGEWSGWKRVRFHLIPTQGVSGICMFYLKQVRPEFKLYVSSINIDPSSPALPISTPESYARELGEKFGPFHTKGLPADTSALDNDILDDGEFLQFDDFIHAEKKKILEYELSRFESGLLFFYFSSTDQRQHMFWRLVDKQHPAYDPELAQRFGTAIEDIYVDADRILARTMEKMDEDTILIAMSDHGFTSFRRSFNLNTWLKENGYHALINEWKQGQDALFTNTNWSRTKAYALGLNSLYINQKSREAEGIVRLEEKESLVREIARKLEEFVDPETGERPVLKAYVARDVYRGPHVDKAPDIIVGYNRGYRVSWQTPLGRIPRKVIEDNREKWSGDHCMAAELLPGILFTNQKIKAASPALYDLTPTVLKIFGIEKPVEMVGKPIF